MTDGTGGWIRPSGGRRRADRVVDAAWSAALLAIATLIGVDVWSSRAAATREADRHLASDAASAGRYLFERLVALDSSMAQAARHLGQATGSEAPAVNHQRLRALADADPAVSELFALDREGRLQATSRSPAPAPLDLTAFDGFRALRSPTAPAFRITGADADGGPLILARPRQGDDGVFAGIVAGALRADRAVGEIEESAHLPEVRFGVYAKGGRAVAGSDDAVMRRAIDACRPQADRAATVTLEMAPAGTVWTAACSAIPVYGLTAIAVVPADASIQPWRVEARYKIGGVAGLAIGSAIIALMRRRMTQAQQRSSILSTAIEQSSNAVLITDAHGVIQWANAALAKQSGYRLDEVVGAKPSLLKSGIQPAGYYEAMWRTVLAGRVWRGEILNRKKTGELYRVRQVITPLLGSSGTVTHFVAIEEDVTEIVQSQAFVEQMKTTDLLTGLPNRAGFQEGIAAIRLSPGRDLVGVLDLTGLSAVNESAGRETGDRALLHVSEALQRDQRAIAIARIGDDEFGFVLSTDGIDGNAPPDPLTALHARVEEGLRRVEGCGTLAVRAGYAVADDDGDDGNALLERAEVALNAGRSLSASVVVRYSRDLADRSARQQKLKQALRGALDAGEITFLLQPKVGLPGGRVVGGELLMRWTHGELGPVSPAEFIPLAERTGDILRLGRAAVDAALRIASQLPAGAEFRIAVNVSAVELSRPDFAEGMIDAVARAGVRPQRLVIELTETAAATAGSTLRGQLRQLLDAGFGIDIDDFGTGYATLSQLRDLPFSGIKIDRGFVAPLLEDRHSQLIVRGVVALATSLGATVVAEGIETAETAQALAELGCGYGQGYLYGRPADPLELLAGLAPPRA